MICRNCSAEIDDDCKVCPVCKKDPTSAKNGKSKLFSVIAVIICFALLCGCVYFGIDLIKKRNSEIPTTQSTTESTSESTSESTTESTTESTSELTSESTSESSTSLNDTTNTSDSQSEDLSTTEGGTDTSDTTLQQSPADSPFNGKTINRVDINDQNGTKLTTRAFVEVEKSKLKKISEQSFLYFLENYISPSTQSWFTIKFEDNTGIVFMGNWIKTASYAELDGNDYIKKVLGRIIMTEDGKFIYLPTPETNDASPDGVVPATETTKKNDQNQTEKKKVTYVYVTASGTKYHKAKCAYLKNTKVKIALQKAKKQGYTACSKCFKK